MTAAIELPAAQGRARVGVDPAPEYRRLVTSLAGAAHRRDEALAAAEHAYLDNAAALDAQLAALTGAVRDAARRTATAATALIETDREAARLWAVLRTACGWRGRRLGDPPVPADPGVLTGEAAQPATARLLLADVATRLAHACCALPRTPLPRLVLPLLPLLGALGAGMLGLAAGGMLTLGQGDTTPHRVLRALGWLTFLVAPSAAVPAAMLLVRHRFGSRLDTGSLALILLGGMVASYILALALT